MDFAMNPEQDMVRVGLSRFLAARYSLDSSRAAAKTDPGWQPEIWRAFAEELGILGATLPESAGGSGGRGTEAMVISEELGRALVIEPFIDTVIVAGGLLARAGGKAATAVLAQVAAGSAIVALAATDADSGDRWDGLSTTAVCDGDDWLISGSKIVVIAAPLATHL
ncbi:MAG: acyl-CoA dehydrogenase family protein, partial [Mycobacterium sp.]